MQNISGQLKQRKKQKHPRKMESLGGDQKFPKSHWKIMTYAYSSKHTWLKKLYGKASVCEIDPKHKSKKFEWSNISGKYLKERSDYRQLCPSCHRKIDHGNFCRKGHEYTEINTYIRKEGWRVCKICKKETYRRFMERKTCKEN